MAGEENLPTFYDLISNWLGVQLPTWPLPQTRKNLDKAIGKILLAAGENVEARIKANTGEAKTRGKINIEGLYRTEEEKRKIGNRAEAIRIAVEELNENHPSADAGADIDDDWLNLFVRLAEDKSSEELQGLFGRILAGEIRKPGSFSLRTIQFISTLSKEDAQDIPVFLSYALDNSFVPILNENSGLF